MIHRLKIKGKYADGKPCAWCCNSNGKPLLKNNVEYSVIDDDTGQYVHQNLIHYCPFCGRNLDEQIN